MKELLSIKEFSDFTGINVTTLRYWDNIGLFSPEKRGGENNYRYYSHQQTVTINFITVLTELKIPTKIIHSVYNNKSPEAIIELLERQEGLLDKELRRLHEMYSIIHTRGELIRAGLRVDPSKIEVVEMDEKAIIVGPPNEFEPGEKFYEPFNNFYNHTERLKINPKFPVGGLHKSLNGFFDDPDSPEYFFSIDPSGYDRKKAGKYLVGYTKGYYGEVAKLAEKMHDYARKKNLKLTGPVYSIYLHDEICMKNPDDYLGQICIPVAGK